MSGQQSHRRAIYHPRRKSRLGKPLWKSKRSSLKIHPSNLSIHPNRLSLFRRSRLFQTHLQPRRSASRSRLAAPTPHRLRRKQPIHRHRHKLRQRSNCQPSVKNRNQTPHREKNPGAALIFGREKQCPRALQKHRRQCLYQKLIQSVREKPRRRTHSGKCSKRATTGLPEQPPQPRKSWSKPRQRLSRS